MNFKERRSMWQHQQLSNRLQQRFLLMLYKSLFQFQNRLARYKSTFKWLYLQQNHYKGILRLHKYCPQYRHKERIWHTWQAWIPMFQLIGWSWDLNVKLYGLVQLRYLLHLSQKRHGIFLPQRKYHQERKVHTLQLVRYLLQEHVEKLR